MTWRNSRGDTRGRVFFYFSDHGAPDPKTGEHWCHNFPTISKHFHAFFKCVLNSAYPVSGFNMGIMDSLPLQGRLLVALLLVSAPVPLFAQCTITRECTRASGIGPMSRGGLSPGECERLKAQGDAYAGCTYTCDCSGGGGGGSAGSIQGLDLSDQMALGAAQIFANSLQSAIQSALSGPSPAQRARWEAERRRQMMEYQRRSRELEEARRKRFEEDKEALKAGWKGGTDSQELGFKDLGEQESSAAPQDELDDWCSYNAPELPPRPSFALPESQYKELVTVYKAKKQEWDRECKKKAPKRAVTGYKVYYTPGRKMPGRTIPIVPGGGKFRSEKDTSPRSLPLDSAPSRPDAPGELGWKDMSAEPSPPAQAAEPSPSAPPPGPGSEAESGLPEPEELHGPSGSGAGKRRPPPNPRDGDKRPGDGKKEKAKLKPEPMSCDDCYGIYAVMIKDCGNEATGVGKSDCVSAAIARLFMCFGAGCRSGPNQPANIKPAIRR